MFTLRFIGVYVYYRLFTFDSRSSRIVVCAYLMHNNIKCTPSLTPISECSNESNIYFILCPRTRSLKPQVEARQGVPSTGSQQARYKSQAPDWSSLPKKSKLPSGDMIYQSLTVAEACLMLPPNNFVVIGQELFWLDLSLAFHPARE